METIPLCLNGYTDLPPGKIASVVTYLALDAAPAMPAPGRPDLAFRHVAKPQLGWYRDLFRRVGEPWLWTSRAVMSDDALAARIGDPATEVYVVEKDGSALGLAELNVSEASAIEINLFGVVPEAVGTGAARRMMTETLVRAFRPGTKRVWLHTCSFDHPAAIPFYLGFGFRPWKFAIEVDDDPRLKGVLPETAAPHIPVIKPDRPRRDRAEDSGIDMSGWREI